MAELHIDEELKAWIDPLSPDEYALLEATSFKTGAAIHWYRKLRERLTELLDRLGEHC
jgi:hypothetical protein